jgi:hypothetical protein
MTATCQGRTVPTQAFTDQFSRDLTGCLCGKGIQQGMCSPYMALFSMEYPGGVGHATKTPRNQTTSPLPHYISRGRVWKRQTVSLTWVRDQLVTHLRWLGDCPCLIHRWNCPTHSSECCSPRPLQRLMASCCHLQLLRWNLNMEGRREVQVSFGIYPMHCLSKMTQDDDKAATPAVHLLTQTFTPHIGLQQYSSVPWSEQKGKAERPVSDTLTPPKQLSRGRNRQRNRSFRLMGHRI